VGGWVDGHCSLVYMHKLKT